MFVLAVPCEACMTCGAWIMLAGCCTTVGVCITFCPDTTMGLFVLAITCDAGVTLVVVNTLLPENMF